jgi:hypothetical protein
VTAWILAGASVSAVFLLAGGVPAGGAPAQTAATLFAGDVVDGLPLTAVLRGDDAAGRVSFVYGDCDASDDAGCAPPVEVQVWPACRRHLGLYERGPPQGPAVEHVAVRGVPAAILDDGARLELQTGRSTVVVFAGSRGRAARVAAALRSTDGSIPAGVPLPAPDRAALDGGAPC